MAKLRKHIDRVFMGALLLLLWHTGPLSGQQGSPRITAVVNAATNEPVPVSPGAVVVVWGTDLGPLELANMSVTSEGTVENLLAGTRILFDGVAAPLIYSSATQVAAVAPYSIATGGQTTVQAEYQGVRSEPYIATTAPATPGIFSLDSSGKGPGVAWDETGRLNSPDAPAQAGSILSFYMTGCGITDPVGTDGMLTGDVLPALTLPVAVTLGGAPAEVTYAGAAPSLVAGITQINVRVPEDAASGDHAFLKVAVDGAESQAGLTVSIAGSSLALPDPPAEVQAAAESPSTVRVAWSAPVDGSVLRTRVERRARSLDSYSEVAVVPNSDAIYVDTAVTADSKYAYRVRFETAAGYSRYSMAAEAATPQPPVPAPSNLRAVATSFSQVNLQWTNNVAAASIRIERKAGNGPFLQIAAPAGSATSHQDRSVSPGTRYSYRVRAEAANGLSAYSAEAYTDTPPFTATAGPPRILAADTRRFEWNNRLWYPAGYYPSVGALTSDQTDYVTFYKTLIDKLSGNNINLMRTVFTMGQPFGDSMTVYQRTGPGLANDGRPKFDLTRFNQAYFDYWRNVVAYALTKGVVVQLSIMDLWHNKDMVVVDEGPLKAWGMRYDFYYGDNNINGVSTRNHTEWMSDTHPVFAYQQALIRKLVDTLGDMPNIIWEIGNETGRTDWEVRMANILTDYERSRGLLSHLVMPRDLPGHQYVPGQCKVDPTDVFTGLTEAFGRGLPLITDNDCIDAGKADQRRRRAWAALTAGAHISLFHFEITAPAVLASQDTDDGMRYVGYLRKFLTDLDVNLMGMSPAGRLVSNGWAYARPGQEYIVYLGSGGTTTVSGLPARYTASWFNPRDGSVFPAAAGPAFAAPDGNDWVLHIRQQ
ncbi:MAG TPA: cellulase family glycosylhydrolase [Bryobacteraceae bacterium]|nr:cellulase family glycosylhydrolase [Bryobacteraceae bacterium]